MQSGPAQPRTFSALPPLGKEVHYMCPHPSPCRPVNAEASGFPLLSPSHLWAHPEEKFRAGNLTDHAPFWLNHLLPAANLESKLAAQVASWVTNGVSIPEFFRDYSGKFNGKEYIKERLPVPCLRRNHPVEDPTHSDFVTDEIRQLLHTKAVSRSDSKPTMVLALGVAAQRTKLRLILDGRPLNLWTPSPAMSYETLRNFQRGLRRKDWMFSLDHKSGYHHLPLTADSRTYVGFAWQGQFYTFNVLPFGWAPACFVYNTLSSVVAGYIRRMAIHTIAYLDDFGFSLPRRTPRAARQHAVWSVMAIMYLAGYTVSIKKSKLVPSRSMELLGFGIDSVKELFFVPQRKIDDLLFLVNTLCGEGTPLPRNISLQNLQSLVGKAQSMSMALPPISIFLRSSYDLIAKSVASHSSFTRLTSMVAADLRSLNRLQDWNRLSKWPSERHISLRMDTDASSLGWGGCLYADGGILTAAGVFDDTEVLLGIHVKEALAIQYTLSNLAPHLQDCFLDLHTDNVIVQHTLLKGSALSPEARAVSLFLLGFQLSNNVVVRVHRIATDDNVIADSLSRAPYLKTFSHPNPPKNCIAEASLSLPYFNVLRAAVRIDLTIDVCAESWNAKLPRFITRYPALGAPASAVNVFAQAFTPQPDGSREGIYCFPPPSLIAPLWRHFAQLGAQGIMLVPDLPTKAWYGSLMAEASHVFTLAWKGSRKVLFSKIPGNPPQALPPIPWNLLAISFDFHPLADKYDGVPFRPSNRRHEPLWHMRSETPPIADADPGRCGSDSQTETTPPRPHGTLSALH
jgi:hypothetical protein